MSDDRDVRLRSDVLAIWYCDGEGAFHRLDGEFGGDLVLSRRQKALAYALLDLARGAVDRSVTA